MATLLNKTAFNKVISAELKESGAMGVEAQEVLATAQTLAVQHRQSGEYIAELHTETSDGLDYQVVAGHDKASHIEWGHTVAGNPPENYETVGALEERDGEAWVRGTHIMRNTAIAHGGKVSR